MEDGQVRINFSFFIILIIIIIIIAMNNSFSQQ